MIAFCSYVLETAVRSQRGIAPLIAYALVMTVLGTSQPFTLDSVAISATVLFPLAAWTGYCAHTWEAPDQQLISAAALCSLTVTRVLRTAVAAALAAVVSCACVLLPSLLSSWSTSDLALGQVAVASIGVVGNRRRDLRRLRDRRSPRSGGRGPERDRHPRHRRAARTPGPDLDRRPHPRSQRHNRHHRLRCGHHDRQRMVLLCGSLLLERASD